MNPGLRVHGTLERLLAVVLRYGTWLASAVIALGLTLAFVDGHHLAYGVPMASGTHLVTVGIALFILLPVLRVMLMAIVFACERDYLFAGIATLVLLIIALGLALGVRGAKPATPSRAGSPGVRAAPDTLGKTVRGGLISLGDVAHGFEIDRGTASCDGPILNL